MHPRALLQAHVVAGLLQGRLHALGSQDVANVLCSMARMQCPPPAGWMLEATDQVGIGSGCLGASKGLMDWSRVDAGNHGPVGHWFWFEGLDA